MPRITIIYTDEIFGDVSFSLNGIHIENIKKNSSSTFETFKGKNKIEIKVLGLSNSPFEMDLNMEKDEVFFIDGYFSKVRLKKILRRTLLYYLILLMFNILFNFISNYFFLFILLIIFPIIIEVINSLLYFFVKKGKYLYLIKQI